jgi:hypothetical protein
MASVQLVGDNIAGNILRLASGGRVDNLNLNAMSIFLEAATEAPVASPSKAQAVVVSRKCFIDSSNHKSLCMSRTYIYCCLLLPGDDLRF